MTPLTPAERAAALREAGGVEEIAMRLVLERDAASGPLVFTLGLREAHVEIAATSTRANALVVLGDQRVARAVDALRAWGATEGRAIVPTADDDRVLPPGYVCLAEVCARFVEALRVEFPETEIECHSRRSRA